MFPYFGSELADALMTNDHSITRKAPTIQKRSPTIQKKRSGASVPHLLAGMGLRSALTVIALLSLLLL